jgi:hypothetical protein
MVRQLQQPAGMWIIGCQLRGPAFNTVTMESVSLRREALTQNPVGPAPIRGASVW